MVTGDDDRHWMRAALVVARRGLGQVWPNPAVGCVIVRNGRAVGRGWTAPGGRPHAETEALAAAGDLARGATAYVSLEPCAHFGRTPPCADALIAAGVARVVVALRDPDPRVDGGGLAKLKAAGVDVTVGVLEAEARQVNAGFLSRIGKGRPRVMAKVATSLDGRIATASGESRWITGPQARQRVHMLRAEADAVLVGLSTVQSDDPQLTCRIAGLETRSPIRLVLDTRLEIGIDRVLVQTATETPTWILTAVSADAEKARRLIDAGVTVIQVPLHRRGLDLGAVFRLLGDRGLTRVLVEPGGRLAAGLLAADVVDEVVWFRSGMVLGGDANPVVGALALDRLDDAHRFEKRAMEIVGEDVLETWGRRA